MTIGLKIVQLHHYWSFKRVRAYQIYWSVWLNKLDGETQSFDEYYLWFFLTNLLIKYLESNGDF